jgi:excinuclease UvrABC nuclease subunit
MASHKGMFGPGMIARWKGRMRFSREMPATGRVTLPCVYVHLDAENRPLYVGYASFIGSRTYAHLRRSPWFPQVAQIMVVEFNSADDALAAEEVAIYAARPPHNVIGKPAGPIPPVAPDSTRWVPLSVTNSHSPASPQ